MNPHTCQRPFVPFGPKEFHRVLLVETGGRLGSGSGDSMHTGNEVDRTVQAHAPVRLRRRRARPGPAPGHGIEGKRDMG